MDDEAVVKEKMQELGKSIASQIPNGFGFFVFVFPFDKEDSRSNYCSNGTREDVLKMMKEFLIKAGHKEDWMKHI